MASAWPANQEKQWGWLGQQAHNRAEWCGGGQADSDWEQEAIVTSVLRGTWCQGPALMWKVQCLGTRGMPGMGLVADRCTCNSSHAL